MNITEMNAQEKSVMLVKLCNFDDLRVRHVPAVVSTSNLELWQEQDNEAYDVVVYKRNRYGIDIYDPANMALAWRVLNWALEQAKPTSDEVWALPLGDELFGWLSAFSPNDDGLSVFELPPAEAQAAWLDKILELAIKAGMVKDG